MLTKSIALSRAQQKKLKIQAKWGSSLALMIWKGTQTQLQQNLARLTGSFQALQREDSSFHGETRLQHIQDTRFMDLR
jgi:hypothetical protein